MGQNVLIMCGNDCIASCNLATNEFNIIAENRLPIMLRGALNKSKSAAVKGTTYGGVFIPEESNSVRLMSWLASRTLSLSRRNGKKLYNLLRASQAQTINSKARISLMCRAITAYDSYWVKNETDKTKWEDVNIRHIPLNEIVTQVALHGTSLSLQGSLSTPEYTTQGAYAKGWRRRDDGKLWLYKLSDSANDLESKVEISVSGLLDKTNVLHCHYEAAYDEGKFVCACPNLADDKLSLVTGEEYSSFLTRNGKSPDSVLRNLDSNRMYQMWVVDYIISNTDRHGQNWGMYMDNATGEILRLHPLFDHNNAFDASVINNPDFEYIFNGKSAKESAQFALRRCDFRFTQKVTKKDFVTDEHWESFRSRCDTLGLQYK